MGVVTRLLARDLVKIQIDTWRLLAWALTVFSHGTFQDNTEGVSIEDLPELGEGWFGHMQLPFKPSRSCVYEYHFFVFTYLHCNQIQLNSSAGRLVGRRCCCCGQHCLQGPIVWRQLGAWLFLLGLKAGQQVFREKALVIASGSQESYMKRFGRVAICFAIKKFDGVTGIDSFCDFFFCYFFSPLLLLLVMVLLVVVVLLLALWGPWGWPSQAQCYELGSPWT